MNTVAITTTIFQFKNMYENTPITKLYLQILNVTLRIVMVNQNNEITYNIIFRNIRITMEIL